MVEKVQQVGLHEDNEMKRLHSVVTVFGSVGYQYTQLATHRDSAENMHFTRPISEKIYPHFHLIYALSKDKFSIHIDMREHRAKQSHGLLSQEYERLMVYFANETPYTNKEQYEIRKTIQRQILEMALFATANSINNYENPSNTRMYTRTTSNRRKKLKKETKYKYIQKKYNNAGINEVGIIEDWEPLEDELKKLTNRQEQDKPDIM